MTYNAGSGLDERVYLLLIHTTSNYTKLQRYRYLHTFQSTVAHARGFSVSTSRLLATDLNTEISTSNHYEVFLKFRLQSFRNLGTISSSGLSPPAYD
jgi:hypothetical protein